MDAQLLRHQDQLQHRLQLQRQQQPLLRQLRPLRRLQLLPQLLVGMMSGMMGAMATGMATGVGMSVASRAVDSMMGPRQTEVVHRNEGAPAAAPVAGKCQMQQDQLTQCMQSNRANPDACQTHLDTLKQCQQ